MLENVAFSTDYREPKALLDVFPIDNFVCFSGNDDNCFQISVPDNRSEMRLNAICLERGGLLIGSACRSLPMVRLTLSIASGFQSIRNRRRL